MQEEKEKSLEEMFESEDNPFESKYTAMEELPEEGAIAAVGKKTQETLTATDLIIDALDCAEAELKRIADYEAYFSLAKISFLFIALRLLLLLFNNIIHDNHM